VYGAGNARTAPITPMRGLGHGEAHMSFTRVRQTSEQVPQHVAFGKVGAVYVTFSDTDAKGGINPSNAVGGSLWKRDAAGQWTEITPERPAANLHFGYSGVDVGPASTKAVVATILSRAGKVCAIRDLKWLGQSAASNTDYLEVACEDGEGLVVRSPLPGSLPAVRVDTCCESGQRGVPCRLSGDAVTAALKNSLARPGVACDAEGVRPIGRETIKRRQVVEFFCPKQQPNGLVAFLPVEGVPAPFEAIDCSAPPSAP
jgi:hypothetical protein